MSITARTIIADALIEIGVIDANRTMSAEEADYGLDKLNRMIDLWNAKQSFVVVIEHNSYTWTTSRTSYTIGPTGNLVGTRPLRIERANLVLTAADNYRKALHIYEVMDWAQIPYPAEDGAEADLIYYAPTTPNGTIYPWPYPEDESGPLANQLELFTWAQHSKFADLSTEFSFPPGYEQAMVLSLAEDLSVPFGRAISQDLRDLARKSRMIIADLNMMPPRLRTRESGMSTSEAWS